MNTKNKKLDITEINTNLFSEISRGIKLGLVNLWRNKLLTLATVLVMAIMICIFNSILAVNLISKQALQNINQKVDLIFYLKDGTDYYAATSLSNQIKAIPGVNKVEYISKEKALNLISKTYPETAEFLLKFNLKNPLPASISISTNNAEIHPQIYDFISKSTYHDIIDDTPSQSPGNNQQDILTATSKNLLNLNNFVRQLIFWVVFIFIIGSTLIIINAIQLTIFTRRNEIYIMRLVGATPTFIRLPFLTEGLFYAISSVLLSFLMLFLLSLSLGSANLEIWGSLASDNLPKILLAEIVISVLISIICSYAAVQQYLRGHLIFN